MVHPLSQLESLYVLAADPIFDSLRIEVIGASYLRQQKMLFGLLKKV